MRRNQLYIFSIEDERKEAVRRKQKHQKVMSYVMADFLISEPRLSIENAGEGLHEQCPFLCSDGPNMVNGEGRLGRVFP